MMTDRAKETFAHTIVHGAAQRYVASRRHRIDAFVDRHFTLAGSLALHHRALGWDLVRAPANLFLAGPALIVSLASLAAQKAGAPRLAAWLARRRILLETEVAREIEWLVATELLEVPCKRPSHASYRDAIAEVILADQRVLERLGGPLCTDSESCDRLVAVVENYLRSRNAAAEIATGFVAAGVGALAVKQVTPGLITLSSALSGMIAQQTAIAAFPLGAALGGLWYGVFPATAGPELIAATMSGVFLTGSLLAAFSGVMTDPLQRRLGLHRRRLSRLLDALESGLCGERVQHVTMRDHYIARLVDLFDLAALALRASQP